MKSNPVRSLRQYARITFDADVQLKVGDLSIKVHLEDIALKGALVKSATGQSFNLHEACSLLLPLAEDGTGLEMKGRIVHLEGAYIGIECLDIDVVSLGRLRRLIELNTGDSELMHRELSHLFRQI